VRQSWRGSVSSAIVRKSEMGNYKGKGKMHIVFEEKRREGAPTQFKKEGRGKKKSIGVQTKKGKKKA